MARAEEIAVVINPRAGAGKADKQLPQVLEGIGAAGATAVVHRTQHAGHATELVRHLLGSGAPGVAVVGGDGTVNEAVNGFFLPDGSPTASGAWLGPLPCGTGGDFRRTLASSGDASMDDPRSMGRRLVHATPRPVDVGWITFVGHDGKEQSRAFLNVASFGIGGVVDRLVNDSPKWMGGRLSFLLGSARAMLTYRNQRVQVRVDDAPARKVRILNMAVANGQYFGGGMHIAPRAAIDDGVFDVVGLELDGALQQLRMMRALYNGTLLEHPGVSFERGHHVVAEPLGATPVELDIDGEAPGRLPASFELRSNVLTLR